ncbi:MAG: MnmC family methyltransferase [Deltaproteobacteria bacterium]|nr:MnmC family methyltransferase [Deltaproteobacteria bacterium]
MSEKHPTSESAEYVLKRQDNGALALFNPALGETMHPGVGPWEEATRLYAGAGGLADALTARGRWSGETGEVVVFDVGLGGAANALGALATRHELAARHKSQGRPAPRPLRVVSFEHDLSPLRKAVECAAELAYPLGWEDTLRQLMTQGQWADPAGEVHWELRMGDLTELVKVEPRRGDLMFFDPFSPRSNPEAWTVDVFSALYAARRPGGDAMLVTYSSSPASRAAMLLGGWFVGKGPSIGKVRQTTQAASRFSWLDEPLDRRWVALWRQEAHPWPLGTPPSRRPQVRRELLEHLQWMQAGGLDESDDQDENSGGAGKPGKPGSKPNPGKKPGTGKPNPGKRSGKGRDGVWAKYPQRGYQKPSK